MENLDMILNSSGPNLKETEELVKYVSTEIDHPEVRDYILGLVDRIIAGYEHQSGKDYTGYLP
ncbi:hypothetical protein HON71_01890 [Candidatus Woesearchaeota archaeon]|jgi:hypothetical protein|nr:hypothetical protein [Candidatus Woesearchaeota archaeon]MBT5342270.1 hypothetical protein [Candidatus Woesearchaeota archaeon]